VSPEQGGKSGFPRSKENFQEERIQKSEGVGAAKSVKVVERGDGKRIVGRKFNFEDRHGGGLWGGGGGGVWQRRRD